MIPEGYKKLYAWRTSKTLSLLWFAYGSIGFFVFGFIFVAIFNLISQKSITYDFTPSSILLFILASLIVVVVHEGTHGIAAMSVGGKPRYGISVVGFLPVFYTTFDETIKRNKYIFVSFAPLVGLSLLGVVIMFFVPYSAAPFLILCMALNAAGAVGDSWLVKQALRYPKHVLIKDEMAELVIFGKETDESKNIPSRSFWPLFLKGVSITWTVLFVVFFLLPMILFMLHIDHFYVGPKNGFFNIYYFEKGGLGYPFFPVTWGSLFLCLASGLVYAVSKTDKLPGSHSYSQDSNKPS